MKPHHRLLIRYASQDGNNHVEEKCISIVDDDTFPKQKHSMIIPMSIKRIYNPMIVCSSQGLFCFYNGYSSRGQSETKIAVLWNPTIGKSVDIHLPNVLIRYFDSLNSYGFGICPHTSDLKLVKIISSVGLDIIPEQLEVFTLRPGFWRSPRSNLPRKSVGFTLITHKQVVTEKIIYWLAFDRVHMDGKNLIMSFDMISEEFVELHLAPRECNKKRKLFAHIYLKDSLVVVETNGTNLPVWIMQNGDPKTFRPIFTINTPNTWIRDVLGFKESGEPILVKETKLKEDKLFVYEPNLKQI